MEHHDTTVMKVDSSRSPTGSSGQKYLATGKRVSLRLWEEVRPGKRDGPHSCEYETIGYVIRGRAVLHLGEQVITLEPGDSWTVPKDAEHWYEITDTFTAVEATSPPAFMHQH